MLDRFSSRYYYETKFMEDDTVLWLWETNNTSQRVVYVWNGFTQVPTFSVTQNYSNSLFIPAEYFTTQSTPDYFLVDVYGISSGSYSAYRSDKYHSGWDTHYDDHYFSGGSGACLFLGNVKIRLKDENLVNVIYTMSGKKGPVTIGGNYDWQVSPSLINNNINDWKLALAGDFETPNGIAPAGTIILAMSSAGNARMSSYKVGNGANTIYVPTQCGFPVEVTSLTFYETGVSFTIGQWLNHEGIAYQANSNFIATDWATDSVKCTIAPTYISTTTYNSGTYLYWNSQLYRIDTSFKGDEGNSLLGFSDYFLKKDLLSSDERRLGINGAHELNSPHYVLGPNPNRIYTSASITESNSAWLSKTLAWGKGQDNYRQGRNGQGGGLVMIYHGETS